MSKNYFSFGTPPKTDRWDDFDGIIIWCAPEDFKEEPRLAETLKPYPDAVKRAVEIYRQKLKYTGKPGQVIHFDVDCKWKVALATPPRPRDAFFFLETARKIIAPLYEAKVREIAMPLPVAKRFHETIVDTCVSAIVAIDYKGPRYKVPQKPEQRFPPHLAIFGGAENLSAIALRAERLTWGTNLVRRLSSLAGNDLTSSRYVELATRLAKENRCDVEFFSYDRLLEMKAGAFMAVAQGSEDRGGGILKVTYKPPQDGGLKLGLVGKGLTYDTGGNNLKTGGHMYGMHMDMAGSAVALSLVLLAARSRWPFRVEAYLAITDNVLGPKSYRPNDVVTSLRGKTIEIVDTDAEGRMVLADTLWIASQAKPDLLIDFATLTGACVRAIGRNYSGAFTNRRRLQRAIVDSGRRSGERVWPFPNDPDYGRCLKSDVADIKQCRQSGGSDHIEAAYFLGRFVDGKIPWVHVDLSAIESEEELAHIPSKVTGFGVRFAVRLVEKIFEKDL